MLEEPGAASTTQDQQMSSLARPLCTASDSEHSQRPLGQSHYSESTAQMAFMQQAFARHDAAQPPTTSSTQPRNPHTHFYVHKRQKSNTKTPSPEGSPSSAQEGQVRHVSLRMCFCAFVQTLSVCSASHLTSFLTFFLWSARPLRPTPYHAFSSPIRCSLKYNT